MKVGYIYDKEVGLYHYGPKHPMKPFRIAVTHSLVKSLGLENKMTVIKAQKECLTYHTSDYMKNLGVEETSDCPNFLGLKNFCKSYASGSINAAKFINKKEFDVVINWAGGLHHAHKTKSSGFCFVNDIVMAIIELLKVHERIMYIDIDVHHGDGVEDAFFTNDRVLTVSFHRYGNSFFPETGSLVTTNNKAVNVPLLQGCTDAAYSYIFEPIVDECIKKFSPNAIVMQCGADSLGSDRLGVFNLSIDGHSKCVTYVAGFGIPTIILGGGGYTLNNVSRCWAYETAMLCGATISNEIPKDNPFYSYFSPGYEFKPNFKKKYEDKNDKEYLDCISEFICEKINKY